MNDEQNLVEELPLRSCTLNEFEKFSTAPLNLNYTICLDPNDLYLEQNNRIVFEVTDCDNNCETN